MKNVIGKMINYKFDMMFDVKMNKNKIRRRIMDNDMREMKLNLIS